MATKKISDLTAVNLVSGSALIPIVQDGATVAVTFADLTGSIEAPVTSSYALSALTASYAISASYEISYETSSSYAETASFATFATTATSASYAATASRATTASYAATAATATTAQLGIYNDTATIQYIGSGFVYPDAVSVDGTTGVTTLVSATVLNGLTVNQGIVSTGSLIVKHHTNPANFTVGVDNANNVQIGASGWLPILLNPNDLRTSLYNSVHISGSVAVQAGEVLTLAPVHPLPNSVATGSFAVSGSTPPKPYFWDGSSWNPLY
jgi:hypothetical protein